VPISDTTRDEAQRLIQRYPVSRSALLPLLHLVQAEEGYVSEDGIAFCAEVLGLTKAEVGAVSTFYTMFKREPFGDYLLSVCTNPTCKIAGGQEIYESYVERCGGHVDPDGRGVMVEHAECLGICDAAPVVQVNYEMYGPVGRDEALQLLDKARAGDPPASNWSQEVPRTFREVERELSGIEDGVDAQLIEAARLQAAAAVPPSYRTGETDLPVTHPGGEPAGHGGELFRSEARMEGTGDTEERPEQQVDAATAEQLDEVAQGTDVSAELAEQVAEPVGETPAAQEQPDAPVEGGTATSPEAGGAQAAVGSEEDPQDSTAGEKGAEVPEEPPTGRQEDVTPDADPTTEPAPREVADPQGDAPEDDTPEDDAPEDDAPEDDAPEDEATEEGRG
jgi:NADH-quinone oxidoreductase subunit E